MLFIARRERRTTIGEAGFPLGVAVGLLHALSLLTIVLPVEVLRRMAEAEQTIPLFGSTQGLGPAFWILWGAGNFLFPMVLLAMVVHEALFVSQFEVSDIQPIG